MQAKQETVLERETVKEYLALKNLLKSGQKENAIALITHRQLLDNWRQIMHYAMTRRNCAVTSLLIDQVYVNEVFRSEEIFRVEISKLLHGITVDFSKRVTQYLAAGKYHTEEPKYVEVLRTVESELLSRTGSGLVNLNDRHFDGSYLGPEPDENVWLTALQ